MLKKKRTKLLTAAEEVAYINQYVFEKAKVIAKPAVHWLSTGSKRLNKVIGSEELGLSSGKIYLIAGVESSGKSLIAAFIAAIGQADGWDVAWVDGENSYDANHVRRQGLHPSRVALFYPQFGEFKYGKNKDKKRKFKKLNLGEVESAESVFTRVELWMKLKRKQNNDCKLVVVVDSTNAFSPKEEQDAGLLDANMRSKVSPAEFLNRLCKRFGPLAVHTNAIIILISQLRTNPMAIFGNPEYVSGGKGLKYFPASIDWMRRVKGGKIEENGKRVGVFGMITNMKNKVGGGSVEMKRCGYQCYFFKRKWKFLNAAKLKKQLKTKEE